MRPSGKQNAMNKKIRWNSTVNIRIFSKKPKSWNQASCSTKAPNWDSTQTAANRLSLSWYLMSTLPDTVSISNSSCISRVQGLSHPLRKKTHQMYACNHK